jgi:hypothetical protein
MRKWISSDYPSAVFASLDALRFASRLNWSAGAPHFEPRREAERVQRCKLRQTIYLRKSLQSAMNPP